jgi:hypothetical protein
MDASAVGAAENELIRNNEFAESRIRLRRLLEADYTLATAFG